MSLLQILPILAYALCAATLVLVVRQATGPTSARISVISVLALLFFAFSLWTVAEDGLIMFWTNHTANLAGNQVWFDLLIAVCVGFYLIAPRARAVGMRLAPWAVAVGMTACIALLPMLARVLWLEQKQRSVNAV
ncbi:MAG: hypothetical protein AAF218_09290 [Pseudomonadota bacterium]